MRKGNPHKKPQLKIVRGNFFAFPFGDNPNRFKGYNLSHLRGTPSDDIMKLFTVYAKKIEKSIVFS